MSGKALLRERRNDILAAAKKRGAEHIRVFGSVIREEENDGSDIDLLVVMLPGRSLLDLIGLNLDLNDLLGREVDVVDEGALSPYIRDHVLSEAVAL